VTDKIGILFLQAQEAFGADAAVHADIMRHLDRSRFDVHLACTAGDGEREPASLAALRKVPNTQLRVTHFAPSLSKRGPGSRLRIAAAGTAFLADFAALCAYMRREKIAIVHSSERPRDALYNVSLAKLTGAKSVVHVHVKWTADYSKPSQFGVRHADAIISISRFVTRTLVEWGRSPASIHTVLNGLEIPNWDPNVDGSAVRRELGIAPTDLVLACVSRLFSWKGQRELVRAFARVYASLPNARLLVVGPDVEGGRFLAELEELASSLGCADRVQFTGPRSDVPQVMAACDVFSMASFEEPFGLVFLEAMAMKKPVIGLDNGGTPEVIEHGKTGLLSPPWDIAALAENMLTLLRDADLRRSMGEHGRARVLEHFSAERVAQDAATAYQRILAAR